MTGKIERRPYSPSTLAERWGCSTTVVYSLLASGDLSGWRLGKLWRISADAVDAFEATAPAQARDT